MSYKELFTSLKIPLAQTSSVFVGIFTSIATMFDVLQDFLVSTVEKFFISTSSDVTQYAKERGIYRAKNESDEAFKNRVLNAFNFLQNSSTRQGIEDIIKNITLKDFILVEPDSESFILSDSSEKLGLNTILQDTVSSSYLFFLVIFSSSLTTIEYNYISDIINIYKPAHIGFAIHTVIDDSIENT